MAYGVKLRVWGDFAAFNRPEMKVERVSYDCITPSAARGILEAIYWKPQIRWVIDRLQVLKPIQFTQFRRNEVASKISSKHAQQVMKSGRGRLGLKVDADRQQRAAIVLRDVAYGIEAHLKVLDPIDANGGQLDKPEAKHLDSFNRRASRGQYFHHPYLGCREFPASFELVNDFPSCPEDLLGERDLGLMLHDIEFVPHSKGTVVESSAGVRVSAHPRFFQARMRDGVIEVPPLRAAEG